MLTNDNEGRPEQNLMRLLEQPLELVTVFKLARRNFFNFNIFLVAICHSFYVYFLSYNTLHMVGSHHTIYDEAWAG
jgi:hypothetical protein